MKIAVWGLTGLLVGLLALLWVPFPSHTELWKAFHNFCHFPLFGAIALILLSLVRTMDGAGQWAVTSRYGVAMIGVVVLGALSELGQSMTPGRSPEFSDLTLDVLGGLCALGVWATNDKTLSGKWTTWQRAPRKQMVHIVAGLVLLTSMSPVILWAYAYTDRAGRFPHICQFSSQWEMKFVQAMDGRLTTVPAPPKWHKPEGETVGLMEFYAKTYPGFRIDEPYPDWRGYQYLIVEVFSPLSAPRTLVIRIDDAHHNQEHADRFNRAVTVSPGLNHLQISLEEVRRAPKGREMDLGAISRLIFFAVRPSENFSLYFDNLRLD